MGSNMFYILYTSAHFTHFVHFLHFIHLCTIHLYITHIREKGNIEKAEGEREKLGKHFCDRVPLGNQAAHTHPRTHGTARHETISQLDSPPNFRYICHQTGLAPIVAVRETSHGELPGSGFLQMFLWFCVIYVRLVTV